ncbi:DEKNAAC101946 [Brettanomyces naardenensis]|uniref:Putative lipase ATG15 n=1 Tax=Brettanomyces naardenensis TaxID=13370 RepID=A0A448YJC8_BRENA|nr:DEKNAAC101946 [Brettanomyces naardenensis]
MARSSNRCKQQQQQQRLLTEDVFDEPTFTLKHIYHNLGDGKVHQRLDIDDDFLKKVEEDSLFSAESLGSLDEETRQEMEMLDNQPFTYQFDLTASRRKTMRLANRSPDFVESYLDYALQFGDQQRLDAMIDLDWSTDEISVPNVTDVETVLSLAMMSSNAYAHLPSDPTWRDLGEKYKLGKGFGWKHAGVRGHVFVEKGYTEGPPKVVIALKGTTASGLESGGTSGDDGGTADSDKVNDNLLFSCCCARVSSLWSTVCDCYEGSTYQCNQNCVEREMRRPDRYYKAALEIYRNVTAQYPGSEIWMTGHSLGGALASLVGRTYGAPAVTFEAPGELLPARRLHLPMPPGLPEEYENIWHFGNTADPIFLGVCNGASSSCNMAGYAMETQCHSGLVCTYDSVNDLGWHVNMLNHRLNKVIDDIISVYNVTAPCSKPPPCVDCYNWYFVDHSNERYGTSLESSSSSTSTSTSMSSPTDSPERKCLERTWYGRCYKWEGDEAVKSEE